MIRIGYPAQNLQLPETTNRTLRLASLRDVDRLKSIVRDNFAGLRNILRWNAERGIGLFRMGQDLIPFASHPAFPYDWTSEHGDELGDAGKLARHLALENDERVWTVSEVTETARALRIPAITDTLHHRLNPGGIPLHAALDLSLPTWEVRAERPKIHISSQDPQKRPGAHAYSMETPDWQDLQSALDGREADVMVEAKGKEPALVVMGVEVG